MRHAARLVAVIAAVLAGAGQCSAGAHAPLHIAVETWRYTSHSYGIVGQALLAELTRVAQSGAATDDTDAWTEPPRLGSVGDSSDDLWTRGIRVTVTEMPLYRRQWKRVKGLHRPDVEQALADVPPTPATACPDVILRAYFPIDVGAPGNVPPGCFPAVYVFGTTEYLTAVPVMLAAGSPYWDALAPRVTLMPPSRWAQAGFAASGVPQHRMWMLPHGVDTAAFRPAAPADRARLRASWGWDDDATVFLNVGSMTSNKGLHDMGVALMDVAAALLRAGSSRHLILVLKGSDDLYTSAEFARRFLPPGILDSSNDSLPLSVVYTGAVLPTSGVVELMQAADVYLSPYRAEGFNLPVLEAAACGLPVVCTAGGPTDLFVRPSFAAMVPSTRTPAVFMQHYHGFALVPDLPALVAAVTRAVTDVEWVQTARAAAVAHVRRRHSWTAVARQWLTKVAHDVRGAPSHQPPAPTRAAQAHRRVLWAAATALAPTELPMDYVPAVAVLTRQAPGVDVRFRVTVRPDALDDQRLLCVAVSRLALGASAPLTATVRLCENLPAHATGMLLSLRVHGLASGCYRVRVEPERPAVVAVAPFDGDVVVVAPGLVTTPTPRLALVPVDGSAAVPTGVVVAVPTAVTDAAATLVNVGAISDARMLFALSVRRQETPQASAAGAALAALASVPPVMGANPSADVASATATLTAAATAHGGAVVAALRASLSADNILHAVPLAAGKYLTLPSPFVQYTGDDTLAYMTAAAQLYAAAVPGLVHTAPHVLSPAGHGARVRVAFVSTALHNHSLGKVLAGVVLGLPSARFDVIVVRQTRASVDDARDPVVRAFAASPSVHVVTLPANESLTAIRDHIAALRLDVVVYGDIGVEPLTYFLAFSRLAPVQCAFWGSPATTALPAVDYFLTGAAFHPGGAAVPEPFSEQVVRLPGVGTVLIRPQPWDDAAGATPALLQNLGLNLPPESPLLFCPHTLAKLHPAFDKALVQVLQQLPNAHVVLLEVRRGGRSAAARVPRWFVLTVVVLLCCCVLCAVVIVCMPWHVQGFGPAWSGQWLRRLDVSDATLAARVHVLPRLTGPEYAAVLATARVVLDAFPYSGFSTSVEAIAVGTPVVTLAGSTLRRCALLSSLALFLSSRLPSRCVQPANGCLVHRGGCTCRRAGCAAHGGVPGSVRGVGAPGRLGRAVSIRCVAACAPGGVAVVF